MFKPGDLVRTVTDDTKYDGMGVVESYFEDIDIDGYYTTIFLVTLQGYNFSLPFIYNEIILLQPAN